MVSPTPPSLALVGDPGTVHIRRWVKAYREMGYAVTVLSHGGLDEHGLGVPVKPIFQQKSSGLLSPLKTLQEDRRVLKLATQFDLVHIHYLVDARAMTVFCGLPRLLVTPYGTDLLPRPKTPKPMNERVHARKVLRAAHAVMPSSQYFATRIEEGYGVDLAKLHVVYVGVDLETFGGQQFTSPTRLPDEPFTIGFFKHLNPIYGAQVLLKALAIYGEGLQNPWKCLLGGVGTMEAELKQQAIELGIEKQVEFCGWTPHDQLPAMLRKCHVVVSPSIVDESLGVASLEAQALGIPVINSNLGGMPETCIDGKTGFLIPPNDPQALADKLLWIHEHVDTRKAMGAAGAQFVRERGLDWATAKARVDRIQRWLLKNPKQVVPPTIHRP